jgi:hypothetical protein
MIVSLDAQAVQSVTEAQLETQIGAAMASTAELIAALVPYLQATDLDSEGKLEAITGLALASTSELAAALIPYLESTDLDSEGKLEAVIGTTVTTAAELSAGLASKLESTDLDSEGKVEAMAGVDWATAAQLTAHTSNASGHSNVDQDVTIGSAPTISGANITGIIAGEVDQVHTLVRKASAGTILAGRPVYLVGYNVGGWYTVEEADNSDPAKMPAIGIAEVNITNSATVQVAELGSATDLDTSAYSEGDSLFVGAAAALVAAAPTGTALIQRIAQVARDHAVNGALLVFGAGRSRAVPNIPEGYSWVGDENGVAQAVLTKTLIGNYPDDPADSLPVGIVTADVKGLWRFDNTANHLEDRTANSTDLVWLGGTGYGGVKAQGIEAIHIKGPYLKDTTPHADLEITGAATFEFLIRPRYAVPEASIMGIEGAAAAEADNVLYLLNRTAQGSLRIYQEHGANISEDKDFKQCVMPDGEWTHGLAVRAANGLDWEVYTQGVLRQSLSFTDAPTGGTAGVFSVAGTQAGATRMQAAIAGVAVFGQAFTAAQALERYNYLLGA